MKKLLIAFYLDWINNYITVEKFAQDYNLTVKQAQALLKVAREINNE